MRVSESRANLYKLIDETSVNHEPVVLTGKRGNAVLYAEDDWSALCEILRLLSDLRMRASILKEFRIKSYKWVAKLDW